ncbi:selenium binding protein [Rhynchospora pubera]|uniref:Selenium binding protein n=1 Tax=Rhynchospora pubera TaxID=906938 RepID=A0AAV8DSQ1_9POAL|nr:selenium binding protein [Rhynchospora pubera]
MAPTPRRKAKAVEAAVTLSPRRTRSGDVGKRVAAETSTATAAPARAKKKVRFVEGKEENKEKEKESREEDAKNESITIEACKQCNAFKTRALKVKQALETALPAISVSINPLKPRRGCFEIRQDGGQIFISLLNMPRPFTPMKNLDMDELIQDIINKLA